MASWDFSREDVTFHGAMFREEMIVNALKTLVFDAPSY